MKNIHVLPTDKFQNIKLSLFENKLYLGDIASTALPQHIYITSDEEIKEGDWYFTILDNEIFKAGISTIRIMNDANKYSNTTYKNTHFKIILTTDQDLIKEGVQAIPDNFLEFFVKNPSCEYIEIENVYDKFLNSDKRSVSDFSKKYEIIIPTEEPKQELERGINIIHVGKPKQETLEEVAEKIADNFEEPNFKAGVIYGVIEGAKYQQGKMYSEEEVITFLQKINNSPTTFEGEIDIREWFKQFKKK